MLRRGQEDRTRLTLKTIFGIALSESLTREASSLLCPFYQVIQPPSCRLNLMGRCLHTVHACSIGAAFFRRARYGFRRILSFALVAVVRLMTSHTCYQHAWQVRVQATADYGKGEALCALGRAVE